MSSPRLTRRDLAESWRAGHRGGLPGRGQLPRDRRAARDRRDRRRASRQDQSTHHDMLAVGELRAPGAFDPNAFLTHFDTGHVPRLPSGQVLREYELWRTESRSRSPPASSFPAWTYNGQVPGPTIRCTEGDRMRVASSTQRRTPTASTSTASTRRHGRRARRQRCRAGRRASSTSSTPSRSGCTSITATPFRSSATSTRASTARSSSTRQAPRPPADEMVMVMNGFDTNFDGENEVYAVNTRRLPLSEAPDRGRGRRAGADLPGQHHRVRSAQLASTCTAISSSSTGPAPD